MRLEAPDRRERESTAIIPLINVVFLILIFVMLTAVIDPSGPVAVDLPETVQASRATPGNALAVDPTGKIAYDGEVMDLETLLARLRADRITRLTLRADAGLPLAMFLPIVRRLEGEGIDLVVLAIRR